MNSQTNGFGKTVEDDTKFRILGEAKHPINKTENYQYLIS